MTVDMFVIGDGRSAEKNYDKALRKKQAREAHAPGLMEWYEGGFREGGALNAFAKKTNLYHTKCSNQLVTAECRVATPYGYQIELLVVCYACLNIWHTGILADGNDGKTTSMDDKTVTSDMALIRRTIRNYASAK